MGDSVIYAITLDYMAYVLDGMGKAEEAMGKLHTSMDIYKKTGNSSLLEDVCERLEKIKAKLG